MTGRRTLLQVAAALILTALPASSAARTADGGDPGDVAALRSAVAAEVERPRAPRLERAAFLARPSLRDVALAPDGRYVTWLQEQGRNRSVWLLATGGGGRGATGAPQRLLAHTEAERLAWTRDSRWILLATPRQVFALAAAGETGSGAIATLGGPARREFVSVDPVLPAAILILERPAVVSRIPRRWRLYRVDMQGRQVLVHEDDKEIVDFAFDPGGRLAFLLRAEGEGHVIHRVTPAGELREAARCIRVERCSLLATIGASGESGDGRDLLLLANAGANFLRLARLEADGTLRTLHVDPRGVADVRAVELDPVTQEPLIASYATTVAESHGLTAEAQRHVEAIQRQFPQRASRIEVGRGPEACWLVHERAGSLRGERLHLYDPRRGDFREIVADAAFEIAGNPVERPPESAMARKIAFTWRASDGMRLHGFLMVPPGIDPSRAPLVAVVHGGPFNLVRPDFSNDGQFLANRGYIAFQPNFRGSTGHGRDYMFSALGDFGNGRVQQDIVDGVHHLLQQGIGDAERVGITGASFGGYSTLVGLTFQPELFKVGVAAVPPADFGWVLREYLGAGTEMVPGVPFAASMRHLDLDPADGRIARRLEEQSPIANAELLRRPLLMLAGGEDERVPIRGVTHYAAQLRSLGTEISLFVDAEAGHAVDDSQTREAYFYLLEALLHLHLGGTSPQPPDEPLRAHLRKNLRLIGSDLEELLSADGR